MGAWTAPQTRDRYDRHVRRAQLSVDSGAPVHRFAFAIEEALRLASLPGENEGRSYYFRHLSISGLPSNGDRNVWMEKFQRALSEEARQAIHGADPRAGFAQAVFFRGEQEALEILLHRVLSRSLIYEWFWPMVTAAPGGGERASGAAMILHIVEKLRTQPASWVAVAIALFAEPEFDAVRLLEAIPPASAQSWVHEMEGSLTVPSRAPQSVSRVAESVIRQALKSVGFRDIRVLWLATLAVLVDSPAELAAGTAVSRAQIVLQRLVSERLPADGEMRVAEPRRLGWSDAALPASGKEVEAAPSPVFTERTRGAATPKSDAESSAEGQDSHPTELFAVEPGVAEPTAVQPDVQPDVVRAAAGLEGPASPDLLISPETAANVEPGASVSVSTASELPRHPDPTPWQCAGLPTAAAGLFFLLNALQRIGISEAIATGLASAAPNFVAQVLRRLAWDAGVAADDPIRIWLESVVTKPADGELFRCDPSWWPSNLGSGRDAARVEYLLRIWCLAVRRWCWRTGKIRVRDVVSRSGVFSVNRTDLDVSLPIDEADIRVRRVGLDLDPGWLPWFGRVVRFHYLFRGEFHG